MPTYMLAFVVALFVTYLLTPQVMKLAVKAGAMDAPDARKVHTSPIPRMGGLAIFAGFVFAVLASMHVSREILGLLIGGTVIVMVGIVDDMKPLSARVKLIGQIAAAWVMVGFNVRIDWLSNPFGEEMLYLEMFSVPFTVLFTVSMINVVNLIDGLDGLAAGVSSIAAVTILLVALQQNIWVVAILTAALAGSALGFLHYNFNPARIFMGDTGSMFLGFMLAGISVLGTVKSAATIALIVPVVAMGLPILDTAFAIIRRYTNGQPIFKPDKGHLHHRLLALGLSQKQAVLLMYAISGCLGVSAIVLTEVSYVLGFVIVVSLLGIACYGARRLGVLSSGESSHSHS